MVRGSAGESNEKVSAVEQVSRSHWVRAPALCILGDAGRQMPLSLVSRVGVMFRPLEHWRLTFLARLACSKSIWLRSALRAW